MSEYKDILDDVVREDAAEQQDTDFEEKEVREQETEHHAVLDFSCPLSCPHQSIIHFLNLFHDSLELFPHHIIWS